MLTKNQAAIAEIKTIALASSPFAANALMYTVPKNRVSSATFLRANMSYPANFRINAVDCATDSAVSFTLSEGTTISNSSGGANNFTVIISETDLS